LSPRNLRQGKRVRDKAMDLRNPKNQKIVVIIVIMLGVVYLWYTQLFKPTQREIGRKKLQYQAISSKLQTVKHKAGSLQGLKRDYQRLLAQYRTVKLLLPPRRQTPALLRRLHRAAGRSEIYISEITPQTPVQMDFYAANPYLVKLKGEFHKLGKFLGYVANFPFIVNISEVKIDDLEEEKSSNTIKAELKLATYNLSPGEKEISEEEGEKPKGGILQKLKLRRKEFESESGGQKGGKI